MNTYTSKECVKIPYINTPEGKHYISPGDFIITGIKGERYPCKPDIFEATNELMAKICQKCGTEDPVEVFENCCTCSPWDGSFMVLEE